MYTTGGDEWHVISLKKYLSKLNPDGDSFWKSWRMQIRKFWMRGKKKSLCFEYIGNFASVISEK